MSKMTEDQVKFPFEPNEVTKAAFRRQIRLDEMTKLITEALLNAATNFSENPWNVLYREHPNILNAPKSLCYNQLTQKVDIKTK